MLVRWFLCVFVRVRLFVCLLGCGWVCVGGCGCVAVFVWLIDGSRVSLLARTLDELIVCLDVCVRICLRVCPCGYLLSASLCGWGRLVR